MNIVNRTFISKKNKSKKYFVIEVVKSKNGEMMVHYSYEFADGKTGEGWTPIKTIQDVWFEAESGKFMSELLNQNSQQDQ